MQVYKSYFFIAALLIAAPFLSIAQHDHEDQTHEEAQHEHEPAAEKNMGEEIRAYIDHHQLDPHDFHLFSDDESGAHYSFPLPVILWDEGVHVFMSSAFHHDDAATVKVESNGKEYVKYHEKIYRASEVANDHGSFVEMDENHHAANIAPLDLSITKGVFSIIVISLFIFWLFRKAAREYKSGLVPTGIAGFLEPLILFVRDEIAIPNIGEKHYRKYMGYLLTVFFFIWIVNLFGLTPLGINITGNIAVTFALALITFIITQVTAKGEYWKHIFWMPGVPVPMKFVLAPIELLGVFIKPFALMIRLFANISAGHIVLMSLIGLLFLFNNWFARGAFLGLTFFLSLIELLVAFLQAYIFTMLTALYFGSAVAEHEEH